MFNFVFLCPKGWFQFNSSIVRTHFSRIITLNNWKIIAEIRSYFFRWRSRFRRRRVFLSSLLCGRRDHMMTKMFNFVFLSLKRWYQFSSRIVRNVTHFASVMTLNNRKMIAETRSYIFGWRSRFRRRRVCVNSLLLRSVTWQSTARGRRPSFFQSRTPLSNPSVVDRCVNSIVSGSLLNLRSLTQWVHVSTTMCLWKML